MFKAEGLLIRTTRLANPLPWYERLSYASARPFTTNEATRSPHQSLPNLGGPSRSPSRAAPQPSVRNHLPLQHHSNTSTPTNFIALSYVPPHRFASPFTQPRISRVRLTELAIQWNQHRRRERSSINQLSPCCPRHTPITHRRLFRFMNSLPSKRVGFRRDRLSSSLC